MADSSSFHGPPAPSTHSVLYVRLPPYLKARLQAYADRAHKGSLAHAVRTLLETQLDQVSGKR